MTSARNMREALIQWLNDPGRQYARRSKRD
jgi:hypothetical protein